MSRSEILTISDVATYLKVTEKTLYALTQRGDLPGFKVGGQWRFRRTAIDTWIDMNTKAAGVQHCDTETSRQRSTRNTK